MLTLPAALLLAAVMATLWTAWRSRSLPSFPGCGNFVLMQLSASWWATAAAVESIVMAPADKLFWAEMAWIGIVGAPSFWTLFIWSYIQGELPARWRLVPAVAGAATWVVALTNDAHHLMYTATKPVSGTPGAALVYDHGLWFFATTIYLYVFMVMSVVVTAGGIRRTSPAHRTHYLGFLVAMAVPWLANIGYVTGNATLFDLDPTPFSFLVMGAVFYWLITRRRLFELLPVARDVLLDAVPDPVLVLDVEGTVVEANPSACALIGGAPTGGPGRSPVGRRLSDLPGMAALARLGVPAEAPQAMALALDGPDGPRSFEVTRVPLGAGPRTVGCLLMLRDVTHRRRAESRLEDTIRRLDGARREAEEGLAAEQQAKQALSGFLSMAAHEFKTPLAIIDGAAQLLLLDAETKAPAMLPRLEKIRRAVRRQVNILETCLADDRLNDPSFAPRCDLLDLPALLRAAVAAQADAAPGRRIELALEGCPPRMSADGPLLELCVHNLLNNALKYSGPEGAVLLAARGRHKAGGTPHLELSVSDRGIGIPPAEAARIFDRFFRATNTGTTPGSGVGLNMVRRIAALHGGTVAVDSRLGEGSTFTLTLPLGKDEVPAAVPVPGNATGASG
ncbi:sensor histidine kinase [Azospirillum picis]|uniref:histidine kinase n=1 Tax=Azospirillum picis TaxID=488438 RepID=A0ABU0MV79_9PROT|nr:histidine kinase N-terminal 7TM domain-containing protein [Azospirillum picis]MBP2303287.1 signal transduction histidine kinase [Azospirillum picis]MDQ0537089.1 signal transduction histidine kinase [Azospirillum picis]